MVLSTTPAGTISHTARGFASFFTRSGRDAAPTALSLTNSLTVFCETSNTTHWCPCLISRRVMLAPIRPSPIIPGCISSPLFLSDRKPASFNRGHKPYGDNRRPLPRQCLQTLPSPPCRDPVAGEAGGAQGSVRARSLRLLETAVASDQTVGRTIVVEHGLSLVLKFGNDALCQNLAQLDAPLVERINIPQDALGEYGVFVKGDQLAQACRSKLLCQNRVGWPVAFENPVWHEPVG